MLGQEVNDVPWYSKNVYGIPAGALLAISILGIWVVIKKQRHKRKMLHALKGKKITENAGNRTFEKNWGRR